MDVFLGIWIFFVCEMFGLLVWDVVYVWGWVVIRLIDKDYKFDVSVYLVGFVVLFF